MIAECGSIRCAGDVHKYQLLAMERARKSFDLEAYAAAGWRLQRTRARVDEMLGPDDAAADAADMAAVVAALRDYRMALRREPAAAVYAALERLLRALDETFPDTDAPARAFMAADPAAVADEQGWRGAEAVWRWRMPEDRCDQIVTLGSRNGAGAGATNTDAHLPVILDMERRSA